MNKLLGISAVLMVALMVLMFVGCAEEEEEKDTTPPTLVSATPASGSEVAANASVTLVFSEKMGSVEVAGAAGTVNLGDGKTVTWTPTPEMPTGTVTLTVTGKDVAGNALAAVTLTYTVKAADKTPPEIDNNACSPKNGETGVDPAKVDKIVIVANEGMKDMKIASFEPTDAKIDAKFDGNKTLTISFLGGYRLGNEVKVIVKLEATDLAGNKMEKNEYTFVTMKKEG